MFIYLLFFLSLFTDMFAENEQNLSMLISGLTSLSESSAAIKTPATGTPIPAGTASTLKLIQEEKTGPHLYTEYQLGNYKILLIIQDILKQPADAIVNAANSGCLGGGGIDGIISKVGGEDPTKPGQYTTLYDLRVALPGTPRCPLGDGRITRGGWLQYPFADLKIGIHNPRENFNYVIHAVGPQCSVVITLEEKTTLANTYVNVLERVNAFNRNPKNPKYAEFEKIDIADLRENYQINSLNFPTISTGIFGCSTNETAHSVVTAVYNLLKAAPNLDIKQINFVFWDPGNQNKAKLDYNLYQQAFSKYLNKH